MCYNKIAWAVVTVGLLGSGPVWAGEAASPAAATAPAAAGADAAVPKIRCDEKVYEFSEVWSGDLVKHTYIIHNDGDAPLEIVPKPTCGCTVAKDYDKVIAPGQKGRVTAILNTRRMRTKITKKIPVTSNDPANPRLILTITGEVKPRIEVKPAAVNFGRITADSDLTRIVKITNHTSEPMKLEPIPPPPGRKSIFTAEINEIEPGKVVELKVTANRPFKHGNNSDALKYKTGIKGEDQLAIRSSLYSPPVLEVKPSPVRVNVPVTRSYPQTVQIQYNGEGTMKIDSVEAGHESVKVDLKEQEPGRAFNLTVTVAKGFDPAPNEPVDIVVKTDLEDRPTIKIPLQIRRRQTAERPPTPKTIAAESLIGKPAPAAKLRSGEGQPVEIGPGTGNVTVLNFWASWSEISRKQLPVVQRLSSLYSRRGVKFLNVNLDRLTPALVVMKAAKQMDITMPIATDPRHAVAGRYGVKGPPTLFLIAADGTVEAVHTGAGSTVGQLQAYEKTLRAELDVLLAGKTRQAFPAGTAVAGQINAMSIASPRSSASAAAPRLTLESLQQDTGLHAPGASVSYKLFCRNYGMRPLQLSAVTPSEGLTVDWERAKVLRPGGSAILECGFTAPTQPGRFSHRLTITSNDPARPKLNVTLTGSTRPYLQLSPPAGVDFGRNPRTQTMGRMATLTYNGPAPIEYLSAEASAPEFEATVKRIRQTPNAMVTVMAKGPFEIGEHKAVITVKTNCKQQPVIEVPVALYRPARIEIVPPQVTLPGAKQLQRRTVSIANNGMKSLHILGIERSDPRIRTQFYPEPDGFSYKLDLTFSANFKCGPQGEKVTIRTDDEEYGEIVIPIRPASATGS